MEDNSIQNDKQYKKYKYIVKKWEKEFRDRNGRIPSKLDIKEADPNVRYAYKKYYEIKSEALENTLSEIHFENESTLCSPDLSFGSNENLNKASESEDIDRFPSSDELSRLLSRIDKNPINESLELPNQNHKKTPTSEKKTNNSLNQLSKKLFQNVKFNIRNPRKSLSRSTENSQKEESLSFSDSSTIENSKDCDKTNSEARSIKFEEVREESFSSLAIERTHQPRNIDRNWVSRALNNDDSANTRNIGCIKPVESNDQTDSQFGIKNLPNVDKYIVDTHQLNDVVENSDSDTENRNCIIDERILKPSIKKLKLSPKVERSVKQKRGTNHIRRKIDNSDSEEQIPQLEDFTALTTLKDIKSIVPRFESCADIQSMKCLQSKNVSSPKQQKNINENFIKININKKVFVRGKKNMNFSRYKKQQWKSKKSAQSEIDFAPEGKVVCFKCGKGGHFAKYCTAHKNEDSLLPLSSCPDEELPTLEQVANCNNDDTNIVNVSKINLSQYQPSRIPEEFMRKLISSETSKYNDQIQPLYDLEQIELDSNAINEALTLFGHNGFRSGQELTIKRILCGISTLLILPTGGGKSLTYQLPAHMYSQKYKCITLVISPLVSLMEDQVSGMPHFLKAGCLHSNQTKVQREKMIDCIKSGNINILLISPEALTSSDRNGFSGLIKYLPPIAFACIDEAHCVSQWSHNFRPSYLMICKVLRDKLKLRCILGLTATATKTTIQSVISHIGIPDGMDGVITNPMLPDNLYLSASFEKDKDRALLLLLSSELFISYNSIIVYCIRREDCERVASLLRSNLQEMGQISYQKNNKRKRSSTVAEAYHAGMSAAKRKRIQEHFMSGNLKIIVATVAFGMGINKSDIRGIIHYSMPSSFESYVQEVGRAGRDGDEAHCHVFLNLKSNDKDELLKHIYANSIDRSTIRKLIEKVFVPCKCNKENEGKFQCSGHEVAFSIEDTVEELDMPAENISTLLCYLELHDKKYIELLNSCYVNCKIFSYGGFEKFEEAAPQCLPLMIALKLHAASNNNKNNILEFSVIEVASIIGWESGITKYQLKNLEWTKESNRFKKSVFKIEFNTLGFHMKAPGNLSSSELDEILNYLHSNVQMQEKSRVHQLGQIFNSMGKYAFKSVGELTLAEKELYKQQSSNIKTIIHDYFYNETSIETDSLIRRPLDEERAASDIRALIISYKDCKFTGRSIARILQGISSPNYPALVWSRCRYWRSHLHEDFYGLVKIATQQIISLR